MGRADGGERAEALIAEAEAAGFAPLGPAELRLLRAWAKGATAQIGDARRPDRAAPANAVRGALLAWTALLGERSGRPSNRLHLIGACIEGPLDLAGRVVRIALVLQRCRFGGPVILSDAATATVALIDCRIAADPRRRTSIDGRHLSVVGDLRVRDTVCEGGVALGSAEIRGDLDVSGSSFGKRSTSFHGHDFEVSLGMPNARVRGALTMLAPPAEGPMFAAALNLSNAEVDVLQDDPACWPAKGGLFLNGFRYRQIGALTPRAADARTRARWLALQPAADLGREFKPQPFEQLARVLRATGHALDARRISVLKERCLRRAGKVPIYLRPFHWLFGLAVGYGYWTSRVVLWLALATTLGAAVFEAGWRAGAMTPAAPEALVSESWARCAREAAEAPAACWRASPPGSDYEPFHAALYAFDLFVPLVSMRQSQSWSPSPERGETLFGRPIGAWVWGYRFAHELLGYILCGFAAVGFAKLAERE